MIAALIATSLVATTLSHAETGSGEAPAGKPAEGVSLTVYSSADPAGFDPQQFIQQQRSMGVDNAWGVPGYGVVKVVRKVAVPKGIGDLAFTDVAAWIDPTTVSFVDLDDPKTTVVEQNFQFDLVSPSKLMEKYLGREISLSVPMGDGVSTVKGRLLSSVQGSLVLETADGVRVVPAAGAQAMLGELPGGLLTKPTLIWKLASERGGEHLVRTTYQTAGMTWRSDYNIVLDGDDAKGSMTAWVTLMNLSGASYVGADLKLVAGTVQRVQPRPMQPEMMYARAMADSAAAAGFSEKSFFEYHLYTLPRKTDVMQNSTQQIALFPPANGFKVTKELVIDFTGGMGVPGGPMTDRNFQVGAKGNPSVFVAFENTKENALGMPLPAGKVRVYKEDPADGTLEFVGEDLIGHTPRNETVKVKLGESFDVVSERKRTDFTIDEGARRMTETFSIEIRNQKAVAQKVRVMERLFRWTNWKIETAGAYEKLDANTVAFDVEVPAEGKRTVSYRVAYSW
ncbi:MAG: DUF4139 domain-containing protein [Planctomycetota bacterium]